MLPGIARRHGLRHKRCMEPVVRFAPSPTGRLHIGNARPALFNWLFALKYSGQFILRYDDTDKERSTEEFARGIATDLDWLGVKPHAVFAQSDRVALYDAAADRLRAMGRLYACYETSDELDRRRKRQLARGMPPIYDRAALKLTGEEKAAFDAEGRKPHWRFRLDPGIVAWNDMVRGEAHIDSGSLSDPVLIRGDGTYLYTLPSVVDDIEMGITHVIRGEDHVTNTGVQIQIIEALGGSLPIFGHHNLLTTASGEGLSKRLGHLSLASLRENGIEPLAVAALATLVGSADAVRPVDSMAELADLVDLAHVSRTPAKFDESELENLNARTLHQMSFEAAEPRLGALGIDGGEAFWLAVRGNLRSFGDVRQWWDVVAGTITPVIENADFAKSALAALPPGEIDLATWKIWTDAVKVATDAKGKALFMPLRLALTGKEHGPELAALLPIMGRERIERRLAGETA
jgi:glutamyl-tRNA synthetase